MKTTICCLLGVMMTAAPANAGAPPSLLEPYRTGAEAPLDAAVVIGNEDYVDLPDVSYANRDAAAFRTFLRYTRGLPDERIHTANDATRGEIVLAVEQAAKEVEPGGLLWVYFAGHGVAHPVSKERMLLGRGASMHPDVTLFEEGAVSLATLEAAASAGRGDVLFVLDACYGGKDREGENISDGRLAIPPDAPPVGPRVSYWTATGPNEIAGPLHSAEHGAFTYFTLGALRGWADGELKGDLDGVVTGEEAQAYTARMLGNVESRAQTPTLEGDAIFRTLSPGGELPPDDLVDRLRAMPEAMTDETHEVTGGPRWGRVIGGLAIGATGMGVASATWLSATSRTTGTATEETVLKAVNVTGWVVSAAGGAVALSGFVSTTAAQPTLITFRGEF